MFVLASLPKAFWERVRQTSALIWNRGLGDTLRRRRYFKGLIDLSLVGLLGYSVYALYGTVWVAVIGITILLSFFGRIFSVNEESFAGNMLSPFVSIAVYALCGLIFFWCSEAVIVAALFIIPCVTTEVEERFFRYERNMNPDFKS